MTADPNPGTALAILGSLLEATIRVAVLALVVALALTALRIRTAARLHAWTLVLCAALAMPLLMTTTPAWPWYLPDLSWLRGWAVPSTW